jgi:hypothetical protein
MNVTSAEWLDAGEGTPSEVMADGAIGGISPPVTISIAGSSYRLHDARHGCIHVYLVPS